MMYNNAIENFIDFCDDIMIAQEGLDYKKMRRAQTNIVALNNQLLIQKRLCAKEYKQAIANGNMDSFISTIEKRKSGIQRKINGAEIKHKKTLQKFITLYDEYLKKAR